jgi:hypothetical protein
MPSTKLDSAVHATVRASSSVRKPVRSREPALLQFTLNANSVYGVDYGDSGERHILVTDVSIL